MPVIPATWEAEAQESLEPERQRLQSAEMAPLHSSPGNRVRPCLKRKEKNFARPRRVDHEVKRSRPSGQHGETVSTKNTKISWAWWHVPVVPATQEAEAEELPEPRGGGCSEVRSRHCTPAQPTGSYTKFHLLQKLV